TLRETSSILFGDKELEQVYINNKESTCSYMLALRMEGQCSIGATSTIMERLEIKTASEGSVSTYLKNFGTLLPNTLATKNDDIQMVVFLGDELFSKNIPILVTVEPISSAILRIELADSRKADVWKNHWECLENNGYYAAYLVCDEGTGLCAAQKEALANTFRQPDTYHAIAHQLGSWVKRLEKAAYDAIETEDKCFKNLDSARSDKVINKRIEKFEDAQRVSAERIELFETFSFLYTSIIENLQLFNSGGILRDRQKSEENIKIGLELIESLKKPGLTNAVKKIRRTLPDLLSYFDVAKSVVTDLEEQSIDQEALQALCLAWQWKKATIKAKKADRTKYCAKNEQFCLEFAMGYLQEKYDDVKERVYKQLEHIVQSSALVECINSIIRPYLNISRNHVTQETLNLIMFYHNHRRYKDGKRKGQTPMEILTEEKQEKDWIELLFDLVKQKDPSFFACSN
ncbi:MAG: hypothetical protein GY834_17080, partial [Bacteroidetes bacterium]|nr:hypothetical protein [Bacteroidota bacterium]